MAAKTVHAHGHAPGDILCPDPSAHEKHLRISEQASAAALLVTQQNRNGSSKDSALGNDGKLSSRSAAQSLKYANPQDLPSFPSRGTAPNSANAAAMLAKDHKMKELWHPEMSAAGSQAAVQAHNKGGNVDLWHPSATTAGNNAAVLAMRNKGLSPQIDRGISDASRNNSLLAAAKSVNAGRQRSGSTPVPRATTYPDQQNSTKNALNAATMSHRSSVRAAPPGFAPEGWDAEANQAARIKNGKMDREMFGEHPPVEPDEEDKRRQAALRASAVSMAKGLYQHQNRAATPTDTSSGIGSAGAETAHRRNQSSISTQPDLKEEALKYIHLQDAAHRLARERLAKVEKDMEQGRYHEYYGYSSPSKKSRLSIRGRGRKRASSEGQYDSDDEAQARQIRRQMSQLTSASRPADGGQRQEDRARLMAAAEKRVHARMHDMDEKVFAETGKVPQSMMDEWEAKAREKAEKDREQRDKHPGMTYIGGGKYMDQAEIEAIAAARLKSTLDEINDTAEKRRARDEEYKRQIDLQETAKMEEKIKDEKTNTELKQIKEQDKAAAKKTREERKAAERVEKDQQNTAKMEQSMKDEQMKVEFKRIREEQDKAATKRAKDERKSGDKFRTKETERDEAADANDTVAFTEAAEALKTDDEPDVEQKTKEKKNRRSVFGRVVDSFKSRGNESKRADEPKAVDQTISTEEPEKPSLDTIEKFDTADEEPSIPVLATTGVGVAAVGGTDEEYGKIAERAVNEHDQQHGTIAERAVDRHDQEDATIAGRGLDEHDQQDAADVAAATVGTGVVDESDIEKRPDVEEREREEQRSPAQGAAALAGAAAIGAGIAGAVAFTHSGRRSEEDEADVSSMSTDEDDRHEPLYSPTSGEHDGSYNFATPSPSVERQRPDLERHISTIQSSASDSDDLSDSDDRSFRRENDAPDVIDQAGPTVVAAGTSRPVDVPGAEPTLLERKASTDSTPSFEEQQSPVSPIPVDVDEAGKIIIVNRAAPPDAEHVSITPRAESPAPPPEPVAASPVVKTGPSTDERAKSPPEKENKGVRGFFRKLKDRQSKPNKLKKSNGRTISGESGGSPDKSFQGGAKLTETTEPNDDITPVTTTSAGLAEEKGLTTERIDTDGPIGDSKNVSGIGGDPRAASPSSFRRHDQDLNNPDDASSSGVEEEDLDRGRGGRLAQKLGLTTGKGKEIDTRKANAKEGDDDEQFEESRDGFDESLAPPPAFTGAKSESPSRGTKFREDL